MWLPPLMRQYDESTREMDPEFQKLLVLIFGIGLFMVSFFFSCSELNYIARGRTAAATSVLKQRTTDGRRHGPLVLDVTYEFTDINGRVRKETDTVPLDWTFPASGPVMIQFIPNSAESSRLAGHTDRVWVYIFVASFVPIGFGVYKFLRFYKS
jgi:hypothetical protein